MKTAMLKKIEEVIGDKDLNDDMKIMLISTYLRIAKSKKSKSK